MRVQSLVQEDPLEKGMAANSSILVWRIPQTEEPGRLQSIGLQRVGHDWSDLAFTHAVCICYSHTPNLSPPKALPPLVTISLFLFSRHRQYLIIRAGYLGMWPLRQHRALYLGPHLVSYSAVTVCVWTCALQVKSDRTVERDREQMPSG